ncbi:uncharacterized protein LOC134541564 [Bacillus rossius redtenbacheri]|uniref:uncharacterized protein LOC134541564 n=1 Tax=Bacillus rossius redtenbacheri TaxID=93214 RepID=UPI002FDC9261
MAKVMERLVTNHLMANPAKCHIGATEVNFLGHMVNTEGNHPQLVRYHWGSPAQTTFEAIKSAFTRCHTLARIDPERPLVLQTDASALGTGAVLYQVNDRGERQVVVYASD